MTTWVVSALVGSFVLRFVARVVNLSLFRSGRRMDEVRNFSFEVSTYFLVIFLAENTFDKFVANDEIQNDIYCWRCCSCEQIL